MTTSPFLTSDDFEEFFTALHGQTPYPWQQRLAEGLIQNTWPDAIDLPTGTGKTACLDIALFALATQAHFEPSARTAPRRLFFCVNRRVIVDEAYERGLRIAQALSEAEAGTVLGRTAAALRAVAGSVGCEPPLDVLELRGGIVRDNRWARSATQPMIVATTVDQLGSRLLFRGYGVSGNAAPVQAGLVAYDSLILLDEAHIVRPLCQTLDAVRGFLEPTKWAAASSGQTPVRVIPMTATPAVGAETVLRLNNDDRETEGLRQRLTANKPARLVAAKKNKLPETLAELAAAHSCGEDGQPRTVAVFVNRVATAREVWYQLRAEIDSARADIELVMGSMRPWDRDRQTRRLRGLVGPERCVALERPLIVVSTQCLEVGADYDFDVLVTQCASLDALRQRFGRLNRAGRPVAALASIVMAKEDVFEASKLDDDKPADPVYGNALARTWNWLSEVAEDGVVDFGIATWEQQYADLISEVSDAETLLAPAARRDAPVLLPAHLDFWVQTSPRPVPDPDVSLFLHGPQVGPADVQVCWRADLDDGTLDAWPARVGLLPPTSAECMPVAFRRLLAWLRDAAAPGGSDMLGELEEEEAPSTMRCAPRMELCGVIWRGRDESVVLEDPRQLRPGDTLVLPATLGGWSALGHVPALTDVDHAVDSDANAAGTSAIDIAELAAWASQGRPSLRLRPGMPVFEAGDAPLTVLLNALQDEEEALPVSDVAAAVAEAGNAIDRAAEDSGQPTTELGRLLRFLAAGSIRITPYADGSGYLLTGPRTTGGVTSPLDEGDDTGSRLDRGGRVALGDHAGHVNQCLEVLLGALGLTAYAEALRFAARYHDLGKADLRFQAMLIGADCTAASFQPGTWAKSGDLPTSPRQWERLRHFAGLPRGFRHELLSARLAEQHKELPQNPLLRDLALHLIAAHHGRVRPFAPVVPDEEPPTVEVDGIVLSAAERRAHPPHRLDSGLTERFWRLTRHFGWWGLAYLEAVLRLSDQQASGAESRGELPAKTTVEATT